jgi:hypothetical protein
VPSSQVTGLVAGGAARLAESSHVLRVEPESDFLVATSTSKRAKASTDTHESRKAPDPRKQLLLFTGNVRFILLLNFLRLQLSYIHFFHA